MGHFKLVLYYSKGAVITKEYASRYAAIRASKKLRLNQAMTEWSFTHNESQSTTQYLNDAWLVAIARVELIKNESESHNRSALINNYLER